MTNCTLFLLFFEDINVDAKCWQLSSVQLQSFANFWFYILLLKLVHKLKCETNLILLST